MGRVWEENFFERARFTPAKSFTGPPPSYDKSTEMVVNSQQALGWDPPNPRGRYSLALFGAVRRKLQDIQAHQLQLYCAVGSFLDVAHGADGFFSLEDDPVGFAVGFDLRINGRRIIEDRMIVVTRNLFWNRLDKTANLIARLINVPRHERQEFLRREAGVHRPNSRPRYR